MSMDSAVRSEMDDVEQWEFSDLFGRYPATVCIVTTTTADGRPAGSTCTAVMSLTADPPTLVVSFMNTSNTLAEVDGSGRFAVNVMGAGGERTMRRFATKEPDKFAGIDWRVPPSASSGAPMFDDGVVAYADCLVRSTLELEDHVFVVGEIVGVRRGDTSVPLLYADRRVWYPAPIPFITGMRA